MEEIKALYRYNKDVMGEKFIIRKTREELIELLFEISRFLDKECSNWQELYQEAQDVIITAYQVMMLAGEKGASSVSLEEKTNSVIKKIRSLK